MKYNFLSYPDGKTKAEPLATTTVQFTIKDFQIP